MTNKRRYTLIFISVTIGTILSVLMLASRGALKGADYLTLVFNMAIAVSIIIALGFFFRKMDKKHEAEEKENNRKNIE